MTAESISTGFGESSELTVERNLGMTSFVAGEVCAVCNNGWMSALETECRPLLLRLLDGTSDTKEYTASERLLLAKWVVKTAIACNSTQSLIRLDPQHIRNFDQGRSSTPGRCGVFTCRLTIPGKFGYLQTSHSSHLIIGEQAFDPETRIGIYLDGIVFMTAFVDPELGYTFEISAEHHLPLWPERGHDERKGAHPANFANTLGDLKQVLAALEVRYRF